MKSVAIKENHELLMLDTHLPRIDDNDLLVKTLKTGLCSTERELFDQEIKTPKGSDFLILGHESVGEIIEVGKNVNSLKKGDIVVPSVRRECGKCYFCENGRSDLCSTGDFRERGIVKLHGFMSEYFIEKEKYLTKIPKKLKSQAVLLEPLTIGIKAIEEYFKIQKGRLSINSSIPEKEILKNILIIGTGPIGLLAALVATLYDANLTCIDVDKKGGIKSILTEKIGGKYIDIREYIKDDKINVEKLRKNEGIKDIDLIIDASPNPVTCLQLIDLLSFNGAVILLGLPYGNEGQTTDLLDHYVTSLVLKNGVIIGSVNANPENFKTGIRYMKQFQKKFGEQILDQIITHQFHFTDYQKAFEVQPKERIKVVLNWEQR